MNKEEKLLAKAKLKITTQRKALLKVLLSSRIPLTVFEITGKVKGIDQATVYRNLLTLSSNGILRRVDFNHGHSHYEVETTELSPHLVCKKCETVEKISGVPLKETLKKVFNKSKKFKVPTPYIEFYGICRNCVVK